MSATFTGSCDCAGFLTQLEKSSPGILSPSGDFLGVFFPPLSLYAVSSRAVPLRDEPKAMSTVLWIGMSSPQTDHQAAFSPDHLTLEIWGP